MELGRIVGQRGCLRVFNTPDYSDSPASTYLRQIHKPMANVANGNECE